MTQHKYHKDKRRLVRCKWKIDNRLNANHKCSMFNQFQTCSSNRLMQCSNNTKTLKTLLGWGIISYRIFKVIKHSHSYQKNNNKAWLNMLHNYPKQALMITSKWFKNNIASLNHTTVILLKLTRWKNVSDLLPNKNFIVEILPIKTWSNLVIKTPNYIQIYKNLANTNCYQDQPNDNRLSLIKSNRSNRK